MAAWALGISIFAALWSIGCWLFVRSPGLARPRSMKQVAGDNSTQTQVGGSGRGRYCYAPDQYR